MKLLKIYAIASLFLFANVSYAQEDSTTTKTEETTTAPVTNPSSQPVQKVRLGIYGDLGFSYLKPKSNEYESLGVRGSYAYGLVVDVNFTNHYTFSTGVKYASYGGKLKFNDQMKVDTILEDGVMSRKYRVNYIELPILLKLKTNQMGYITPFVQIGLHNGFRLSAFSDDEFSYSSGTKELPPVEGNDIIDETAFYRLSLEFSIGAEYEISQSFAGFAILSFHNGLTNSLTGTNYNWDLSKENNQSAMFKKFALTVGFMF